MGENSSVAKAIKLQIKKPVDDSAGDLLGESTPEIFDENENPLGDWSINEDGKVTVDQIYTFLTQIFKATKMKTECAIMTLAYIERLLCNTKAKIELTASTWRRIVLAAMIVSDKVFEDYAVWNVDFMNMVPLSSVEDLNKLERKFLTYLNFKVSLFLICLSNPSLLICLSNPSLLIHLSNPSLLIYLSTLTFLLFSFCFSSSFPFFPLKFF